MSKATLKVALIQHPCMNGRDSNLHVTEQGIRKAASEGAQLVLLQELHTCVYFCQTENAVHFELAESIPGPTTQRLSELAHELKMVIVASIFERRAAGIYHNTAVVFEYDGNIAGTYRKMHIPDDPGYYEKFYFTPGDQGFKPIKTSIGRLGVLICWDQWFPEAARLMTLAGADMLLYPSAIGYDPRDDKIEQARQKDAWVTVQRAHAIANGLPILVANRTGEERDPGGQTEGIQFWGSSFATGPQGEILAQSSEDEANVLLVQLDLSRSELVRQTWPYLRDRRIDAYQDLSLRYRY